MMFHCGLITLMCSVTIRLSNADANGSSPAIELSLTPPCPFSSRIAHHFTTKDMKGGTIWWSSGPNCTRCGRTEPSTSLMSALCPLIKKPAVKGPEDAGKWHSSPSRKKARICWGFRGKNPTHLSTQYLNCEIWWLMKRNVRIRRPGKRHRGSNKCTDPCRQWISVDCRLTIF